MKDQQRNRDNAAMDLQTTTSVLIGLWSALLRVNHVGVNDNFFALGGDSMLSVLLSMRAREQGICITPKQIFETQTISALARVATSEVSRHRADANEPGEPTGDKTSSGNDVDQHTHDLVAAALESGLND